MGLTSIEWTSTKLPDGSMLPGYTFNPWWGCTKVSAGCKNCYAETLSRRFGGDFWGPGADRRQMSAAYWKQPLKWNALAEKCGVRRKVFCASMADLFEGRETCHNDDAWAIIEAERLRLWALIANTTNLDWLLLTKRPENIISALSRNGIALADIPVELNSGTASHLIFKWSFGLAPANVWIGTSVNDRLDIRRIEILRTIPAAVHFLSIEPLLEDLGDLDLSHIEWIIAGGESGPNARPMNPNWARSVRDQCTEASIPFFFKQWGMWAPGSCWREDEVIPSGQYCDFDGRLRGDDDVVWCVKNKHDAGRLLDGVEHSEFPEVGR